MTRVTANLNATADASLVQPPTTSPFWGIGPDGHLARATIDAYGGPAGVDARSFNGTGASPSGKLAGDVIATFVARAFVDASHPAAAGAFLQFVAAEDQTPTGHGAYVEVWTTPAGSVTATKVAQIGPAAGEVILFNVPSADPGVSGQVWDDSTYLRRSV